MTNLFIRRAAQRLPSLFAAVLVLGCAGQPLPPADPELGRLVGYHTGVFTSAPQAARDSSYQVVAFRAVRIWPGRDEGYWVYTEQQIEGQERPYRQRIQRYFRDEQGDIRLRVYTFPQTSEHIGDWQSPERFDSLDPTVLSAEAGCDNLYRQVEPGVFAGSTIDEQCRNTWRGAAFMRSVSSVTATGFTNWDRGFTEEGEHVWGPRGGGYEFTKLSDL